jgi:putative aldouronate transport system permease protein
VILFILGTGSVLTNSFEQVLVTINSAVYESGEIISTYVYQKGLLELNISYATAIGLFQSLVGFALVATSNKLASKYGEYSLW